MGVDHVGSIRLHCASGTGAWRRPHIGHALVVAAAMTLSSIGPAIAQEAETDASQAPALPAPGRNGKVCQYEDVTGSRMKKRVCHTPEQWEARERSAKEAVRELDRKSPEGPRLE